MEEIKAKFAELFQILEETIPTQILPVYANAKQKPSSTPQTEEPSARVDRKFDVMNHVAGRFVHRSRVNINSDCRED